MKRVLSVTFMLMLISQLAQAQFEEVKTLITLNQFAKAKESVDAMASKPKIIAKPEYFLVKSTILSHLSKEDKSEAGQKMRNDAIEAYNKFMQLDPKDDGKLKNDPLYSAAPINFYVSYFSEAVEFFNKKNWTKAVPTFLSTVKWSDFVIENKIATMTFDTTVNLLTAVSLQNNGEEENAAVYYKKLAAKNVTGDDNDIVYRFLMNYYFNKDDLASFEATRKQGQQLYPKQEYFTYTDVDFIMEIQDMNKKFKKVEEKIARDPQNIDLIQTYGFLLFNRLNEDSADLKITNYAEQEAKMIDMLGKAGAGKPEDGTSYYYAGSHYFNKALKIGDSIRNINDDVRRFNSTVKPDKTGKTPPPPKALTDKRDNFRKDQDSQFDKALPFLLKAQPAIEKASSKSKGDLQSYKKLIDQLIEIYSNKRQFAKLPADKTKYEAEEKKWDAVYSKITEH